MPEIYCERYEDAWGWRGVVPELVRVCSRCDQPVLAGHHPEADLVCTHCLSELTGPLPPRPEFHPSGNAEHCPECWFRLRR